MVPVMKNPFCMKRFKFMHVNCIVWLIGPAAVSALAYPSLRCICVGLRSKMRVQCLPYVFIESACFPLGLVPNTHLHGGETRVKVEVTYTDLTGL
jgi:hypothetical protein